MACPIGVLRAHAEPCCGLALMSTQRNVPVLESECLRCTQVSALTMFSGPDWRRRQFLTLPQAGGRRCTSCWKAALQAALPAGTRRRS